ncbi:MBL fold metallo-hydrolase [Virgibacillus byunsanensis]|uniref:MBL fold metallo-hydrolase n=1 Tax=Virgibacillus byunsanensis TaxID=570945 RepID=A0ABW3LKN7_9BACI
MNIEQMALGPLGTNCYIVYKDNEALVIDPGGEGHKVVTFLNSKGVTPIAILLTHAHFDHIGGVETLRSRFNIDVYIHEKEADWLEDPTLNGSSLFIQQEISTKRAEAFFELGRMKLGSFVFDVVNTPGHSPGSVSFIFQEESFVISGDALFHRGIGRTDLPGGDFSQLEHSIKNELYCLNDLFVVYPGHGPKTIIGEEKLHNPFVSEI